MRIMLNTLFSDKYVNHRAVGGNDLLLIMYRFSYPFAVVLNKLRLSPNQITTQSLIFAIFAFGALVYDDGLVWFSLFWGISLLLDFCDGTVARMTDRISKTSFRYDHMSDTFKISLLSLGVGIRNDNNLFWILCATLIFSYNYSEILSHDLINAVKRKENVKMFDCDQCSPVLQKMIREKFFAASALIDKFPFFVSFLKNIYSAVFNFNGHTLLFFFTFPVGGYVTKIAIAYLISLTMISIFKCISSLRRISR